MAQVPAAGNACLNCAGDALERPFCHFDKRIGLAVRECGIPHSGSVVAPHVTLSLGVAATHPAPRGGPESLIAAADAALYRAKHSGRDRVISADPAGGV